MVRWLQAPVCKEYHPVRAYTTNITLLASPVCEALQLYHAWLYKKDWLLVGWKMIKLIQIRCFFISFWSVRLLHRQIVSCLRVQEIIASVAPLSQSPAEPASRLPNMLLCDSSTPHTKQCFWGQCLECWVCCSFFALSTAVASISYLFESSPFLSVSDTSLKFSILRQLWRMTKS